MDNADLAQIEIDRAISRTLGRVAHSSNTAPFTGFCNNCKEAVSDSKRFCDRDCASDFEKITERQLLR